MDGLPSMRANAQPWGDVWGGTTGFGSRLYLKKEQYYGKKSDSQHSGRYPPSPGGPHQVGQWCSPWWYFSFLPLQGQHLAFPTVALWVTVGLAICVVGLLAVLAYVCQKKIRQSCEEEENAGNTAATSPQRGWALQRVTEGDGWGELGQILTGMDLPWWWHLLELLGLAGTSRSVPETPCSCIAPGSYFKHTPGLPATQRVPAFHLPPLSILCVSGTHNRACVEHL